MQSKEEYAYQTGSTLENAPPKDSRPASFHPVTHSHTRKYHKYVFRSLRSHQYSGPFPRPCTARLQSCLPPAQKRPNRPKQQQYLPQLPSEKQTQPPYPAHTSLLPPMQARIRLNYEVVPRWEKRFLLNRKTGVSIYTSVTSFCYQHHIFRLYL